MQQKQTGVTLIELIITVSILSILTMLAVPNYQQHTRRSHRTDAMSALMSIGAAQEKFYFQNNRYGTMAELGDLETEHGYYNLAITVNNANTFTATATASGTPQINDTDCRTFSITAESLRTSVDALGATTEDCWR